MKTLALPLIGPLAPSLARSLTRSLALALALALACSPPLLSPEPGAAGGAGEGGVARFGGPAGSGRAALRSARPGMGATVYSDGGGGTTFRTWAPNADQVFVTGEWNGWIADELANEGSGNFSTDIAAARHGHRYKYMLRRGTNTFYRADPRARAMTSSVGDSVIVDPAAYPWGDGGYGTPGTNELVIYELHIGSFHRTGSIGTFQSAIAKLDHLAQLGVNMIELTPVFEFPTDVSTGYNTAFPFAPESAYGGPADMKRFIDEAHRRGMGVLLDVVHNHWGPNDLASWCYDGECFGAGGVYFYTDWRIHTPWGPRPDYGRAEVRDYIRDSVVQWFREYHADGMRWDATMVVRELAEGWTLMQRVNYEVKDAQPWKLLVAEDFRDNEAITRPTFAGGAGFDSQWDGSFFHPVARTIIAQGDSDRDMFAVRDAIVHKYNGQASQRVIYTENHDEVSNGRQRVPEMIWPGNAGSYFSKKRSTLGAALVMTSPGIPLLFMGQEFLESGWFAPDRPLDWSKTATFGGIVNLYRDLIHLRRNWFNNTRGLRGDQVNVFHVNNSDKIVAFHRWQHGGPGDDVVVVVNFSSRAFPSYHVGLPRWGTWYTRFNSDWSGYSADFANTNAYDTVADRGPKDGLPHSGNVGLGPYTAIILSQ